MSTDHPRPRATCRSRTRVHTPQGELQQLKAPWCPGHPSMVGVATFRLSTSPLHRHCYSSQQDELRTRITGQRACAPALQPGQRAHRPCRYSGAWVRGCARTHPGSARASCVPQLHPPSDCPALLLVLPLTSFGQLAKNLPPTVQPTPQTLALFSGPHRLSGSVGSS